MLEALALAAEEPARANWDGVAIAVEACAFWVRSDQSDFEEDQAFINATSLSASGLEPADPSDRTATNRFYGEREGPHFFKVSAEVTITAWETGRFGRSCEFSYLYAGEQTKEWFEARRDRVTEALAEDEWAYARSFGGHRMWETVWYNKEFGDASSLQTTVRNHYFTPARITGIVEFTPPPPAIAGERKVDGM